MAKLSVIERMFKVLDLEMTDEQTAIIAKMGKFDVPDEFVTLLDEIENNGLSSFKAKLKKSVLEEEDRHLDEFEDVFGKEGVTKFRGARGIDRQKALKNAYNQVIEDKVAAEKALKGATKDGDSEEIKSAQLEIIRLKSFEKQVTDLQAQYDSLKDEKVGVETELGKAKKELVDTKVEAILSVREDFVSSAIKSKNGLKVLRMDVEEDLIKQGLTHDIATGLLLKADGKAKVKDGSDYTFEKYLSNFANENLHYKKMADAQQTTVRVETPQGGGTGNPMIALTDFQKKIQEGMRSRVAMSEQ